MKRFHIHLHVDDLAANIGFYSRLFAAEPTRLESDYAKWMLEDPRLNFAISSRGPANGIDHLGMQTDDKAELEQLKERARAADMVVQDEGATTCCYARSEKHWVTDPQGIAWEYFHTMADTRFSRRRLRQLRRSPLRRLVAPLTRPAVIGRRCLPAPGHRVAEPPMAIRVGSISQFQTCTCQCRSTRPIAGAVPVLAAPTALPAYPQLGLFRCLPAPAHCRQSRFIGVIQTRPWPTAVKRASAVRSS